jgi:hypothetical protein
MGKRLAVYDSEAVSLIVCAIPINDGRAEEFVVVEQDEDSFGLEQGADGSACRYAMKPTLYTVTVKLKGHSSENAKLAALHAADCASSNGSGVGIFLLKDNNGSTLMGADKCWIQKPAAGAFGKTRADVEWILKVVATPAQMLLGGN